MTTTTAQTNRFRREWEATARKAAGVIAANRKRTPAEQAALDAVDKERWVLWHTDATQDLALAVIRLLSNAGLLRDPAHEAHLSAFQEFAASEASRIRAADGAAITRLDGAIESAARMLDDGADPLVVAKGLRDARARIWAARDGAGRPSGSDAEAVT